MKKIYSFVLMAAMLFVGTNAWAVASFKIPGGQARGTLQEAINDAPAGQTTEITMTGNYSGNATAYLVTENTTDAAKHIILNLNGGVYEYTGSAKIAIAVAHGTLEVVNGTIQTSLTTCEDLIRVYGTYEAVNAKSAAPFAHLIINEGVTVQSDRYNVICVDVMRPDQPKLFGMDSADPSTMIKYSCDVFKSKSGGFGVANGARVDIYGDVTSGEKYGVKVNGCVRVGSDYVQTDINSSLRNNYEPKYNGGTNTGTYDIANAAAEFSPYVHIGSTANVTTASDKTKAVAAYSSGFGRWLIEGNCGGSTGLYVKSGQIEVNGGTIQSTNTSATQPVGQGSGVTAGGSAIVVETNDSYSGNISVVIAGDSKITATAGYAIEETITAQQGQGDTEVEAISIQGGTIQGGSEGAIVIENKTKNEVEVVGGNISGSVTEENVQGSILADLIPGTQTTQEGNDADFVVKGSGTPSDPVVIKPNTSKVFTLNGFGLGTFSAAVDRLIPAKWMASLTAYTAKYIALEEILELHKIEDGKIPAGTGVILYGKADSTYVLDARDENIYPDAFSPLTLPNNLHPASHWASHTGDIYVLSGDMMYKYLGEQMKDNKAYLQLEGGAATAPQRMRMVIAETEEEQQTEAISNVETTTVKAVKFMENGEIFIRRGENVYNLQGQIVK